MSDVTERFSRILSLAQETSALYAGLADTYAGRLHDIFADLAEDERRHIRLLKEVLRSLG